MKAMKKLTVIILVLIVSKANAQLTQTIRGTVLDKNLLTPLIGANVLIAGSNPLMGAVTDENGNFKIEKVPIGRVDIKTSYLGYKEEVLTDIVVSSGKEVVLQIVLEENVVQETEVVVTADKDKLKPVNELAVVSATTLRVDETNRYAGSRQDPARVAANVAGVAGGGDLRNDIIVRGNTPMGILWRLEGIEIPNPNHFAVTGTTGGAFSILNNNLLANTDFFTGAFPAEYGNKTAAVFDVRMRNGNNEKREHTFQAGLNGVEFTTEGSLMKEKGGSYLVSYRFLSFRALRAMGVSVGLNGIPQFQDLSFKINLPVSSKNTLSIWAIGGTSSITVKESEEDTADWGSNSVTDNDFRSSMYASGITFTSKLSPKTVGKLIFSATGSGSKVYNEEYYKNNTHRLDEEYRSAEHQQLLQYTLTHKFNPRHLVKAGVTGRLVSNNIYQKQYEGRDSSYRIGLDEKNSSSLVQSYVHWQYRPNSKLDVNTGVYYQLFTFNNTYAVEPRLGLLYHVSSNKKLSFGAGLHSQTLPLLYYTYKFRDTMGGYRQTNRNLDLTRSAHFVAGYQQMIKNTMRFKVEAYYQYLYDVPVSAISRMGHYSTVNIGGDFSFETEDSTVNRGKGENYGIELTFERFFNNSYYFLTTLSLFDSKFQGGDGVWRNTAFDLGHVFNILAGKEFKIGKDNRKSISADIKLTHMGGRRIIPVDVAQSILHNEERKDFKRAFEEKTADYFRCDIKLAYNSNRKKATHQFFIAADNVFNTQNELMREWDNDRKRVKVIYQIGIFPYLGYRVNF